MSAPVTDPFGLVGATLEGRFAVDRVVARGGFGVVYQGRHLRLKKVIALKVLFIPRELGPAERRSFLDAFTQEAQTVANLEHPAIVRVFDFGVSRARDGRELPWMVLEWIEGTALGDWFDSRGRRPVEPREALELLRPVFQALAYAHEHQVAHRDIKPSNVMVLESLRSSTAGLVRTRLLDFGIAKVMHPEEAVGSGETATHALYAAFSLPYAAPEQKGGTRTGPWTDVHALGLLLTELLTGSKPYPSTDRLEVEQRIMSPARPTPALFGVDVGTWEPVLARAVAFRAPERFQSAGELLAALDASVAGAWRMERNVRSSTAPSGPPVPADATVVTPTTITNAPTTSDVLPQPRTPPRRGRAVAAALGGTALLAVGAAVTWRLAVASPGAPAAAVVATPPAPVTPAVPPPRPAPPEPAPPAPVRAEPAPPTPPPPAAPTACANDDACADGNYCNGVERCRPGAEGADARGCVRARHRVSCGPGMACSNARQRCVIE